MVEKTGPKASGRKFTKEQKDQVRQLALQGVSVAEIARQMNVDVLRVSGTVRSAKNMGALPPDPGPAAPSTPAAASPPRPWLRRMRGDEGEQVPLPPWSAWLTKEQTDRVIQLARQGVSASEIARQMGIDVKHVHGAIIAAMNSMLRCVLDS